MLSQVSDHRFHHFGFVFLEADPIFPPFEARSCRFRVIALQVISELLVSLLLQRGLEVTDVFAQGVSLMFVLADLLILDIYYVCGVVLHLLVL